MSILAEAGLGFSVYNQPDLGSGLGPALGKIMGGGSPKFRRPKFLPERVQSFFTAMFFTAAFSPQSD